jgi:tetratricopeptide (TPR) repeat protein
MSIDGRETGNGADRFPKRWIWIGGTAMVAGAAGVVLLATLGRPVETGDRAVPVTPVGVEGIGTPRQPAIPAVTVETPGAAVEGALQEAITTPRLLPGETFYGKGERFYLDGDYVSATRYLREEVAAHPDRFHPSYLLGLSLWKEGRLDESVGALEDARRIDPASVKARVNLGRVLNDLGRHDEALVLADGLLAEEPGTAPAHKVRGRALLNLGRNEEAIEAFRAAAGADPQDAWAFNNLGYALIRAGRSGEAAGFLETAVSLRPQEGVFHNNLGMAREHAGRWGEARAAYRLAVERGGSPAAEANLRRLEAARDLISTEPATDGLLDE